MAKVKISEFSANPANNTDIDGINIAENCPPSGINDAIRELMAQLKDFQAGTAGDSFNGPVGTTTAAAGAFTTLSASGAVTLSAATANGVVYANGSKVLTTGSALTFDGTNMGLGNSSPSSYNGTAAQGVLAVGTTSGNRGVNVVSGTTSTGSVLFSDTTNDRGGLIYYHTADVMAFLANGSEQMRLTSTGLGIGTSSPVSRLHVVSSGNPTITVSGTDGAYTSILSLVAAGGGSSKISATGGSNILVLATNGTDRATLDTSGNLGLGVTPSASTLPTIQSAYGVLSGNTNISIVRNAYYNGGWKYTATGAATFYQHDGGGHYWYNAPSGTAGNAISFTTAMTLDASGRLLLGTTTPLGAITSTNASGYIGLSTYTTGGSISEHTYVNAAGLQIDSYQSVSGSPYTKTTDIVANADSGASAQMRFFTTSAGSAPSERARIDSSGNLLVGTTSALPSFSAARLTVRAGSGASGFVAQVQTAAFECGAFWNTDTASNNIFALFGTEATYTTRGSITYNRAGGLTAYNTTSDYRAKDIIGPVNDSGALIDSTPVYMGKMKGATQERPMFIAHETPAYAHTGEKDAVDADGNPVYQQMDVSALVPVMWAEIQSLRQRLAAAGI